MKAPLMPEHEALMAAFITEERARGRRERGVETLRLGARRFVRFLEEQGDTAGGITVATAREYQGSYTGGQTHKGTPYSPGGIGYYIRTASTFCDWLAKTGALLDNPFARVARVRREKKIPANVLKEHEMAALLSRLAAWGEGRDLNESARRYTVHVIAELQYASGLRIAEVASLTREDVDVERALVYVRGGKHGSNRIGFLSDYAACVLELYMSRARPVLCNGHREHRAAFLFYKGYKWLTGLMNDELARACAESGVPKITSHGFRHALGYHLLRSGCQLRYIQAILGHKSIGSTEVYTKVDIQDVKRVFDENHPRMHG